MGTVSYATSTAAGIGDDRVHWTVRSVSTCLIRQRTGVRLSADFNVM